MRTYPSIIWLNSLFLSFVLFLVICTKLVAGSSAGLFLPPATPPYPSAGFLTHTFQLSCCIPPLVCAFSFGLLRKIQPRHPHANFLLGSSLVTGGFLLNEIYRFHIIFLEFGISKLVTIGIYAIIVLWYGLTFWRQIRSTSYLILLASMSLLTFAIFIDSLHLQQNETVILLEGIPKLFSGINLGIYFWWVSYEETLDSMNYH